MSEKIQNHFQYEATRDSGLIVPGRFASDKYQIPETPEDNNKNGNLYDERSMDAEAKSAEIADHEAYEEIINPINVLHLKEAIDSEKENLNAGSKKAKSIREEYIAEYLQTGNKRDIPRPIPHEIRTQLEDLLNMSYKQLEALLEKSEESQENIEPDEPNNPDNEPNLGDNLEIDTDDQKGELEDPEEEPTKKHEIDESMRKAILAEVKDKDNLLGQIDTADNLSGNDRIRRLGDIARKASAKTDIMLENDQLAIDNMPTYKDIAIMAAVRIRKSKVGNPIARAARFFRKGAASDFYLHEVATSNGGSVKAAESMRRGRHVTLPNTYKGRNDAMQKAASLESSRESLESIGSGLAFPDAWKARHEGIANMAEKTGDPSLENAINGLYDFIERGKTRAKVAVSVAKKGDIPTGIRIAKGIKWPSARKKALDEIAQL
jgi:hypothetical protein